MCFGKFIGFASQGAARVRWNTGLSVTCMCAPAVASLIQGIWKASTPAFPEWAQRAAISARVPDAFNEGGRKIVYSDHRGKEMDHYAATGFYPIMHVVAMRRVEFERYPRVAMNLFKAFDEASGRVSNESMIRRRHVFQCHGRHRLPSNGARISAMIRFHTDWNKIARRLMRSVGFAHAQGVTTKRLTPDDLFPREVRAVYGCDSGPRWLASPVRGNNQSFARS